MTSSWDEWTCDSIEELKEGGVLRTHRKLVVGPSSAKAYVTQESYDAWLNDDTSPPAKSPALIEADKQELTLFSTNDYLGLSSHPEVKAAAAQTSLDYGLGPRSSALIGGFTDMHRELETVIADLKGTEECILFPTGYGANVGSISALGAHKDVSIFSDQLNHSSIVDGCRLATKSGAQLHIYRHNDMDHLRALLLACDKKRKLVVSDTLFSMDGDFADLQGLVELRRRFGFLLAVDEAHATLICGPSGGGACEEFGVADEVDIHLGTLSKGVGAFGGFVCCSKQMRQLLASKCRTHIYSTSLPLPIVASALSAIHVSKREWWRRRHLWSLVRYVGNELGIGVTSPIIPLIVGSEGNVMELGRCLLQSGFHVGAIRPPTVPQGTCRLRISLSAAHTLEDVSKLIQAIKDTKTPFVSWRDLQQQQSRL